MVVVAGDSTRDGRWALVRLSVEEERIVGAEAEGSQDQGYRSREDFGARLAAPEALPRDEKHPEEEERRVAANFRPSHRGSPSFRLHGTG